MRVLLYFLSLFVFIHPVPRTDFLITTSVDGHLKLWKKQEAGIEFVKHYRAHLSPVVGVSASADGQLFGTVSEDKTAKVFDVVNFGVCLSSSTRESSLPLFRYDQYHKAWVRAPCLLLGSSERASTRIACNVRCFASTLRPKVSSFIEALTRLRVQYDCMMVVEVTSRWKLSKLCIASPFI